MIFPNQIEIVSESQKKIAIARKFQFKSNAVLGKSEAVLNIEM